MLIIKIDIKKNKDLVSFINGCYWLVGWVHGIFAIWR